MLCSISWDGRTINCVKQNETVAWVFRNTLSCVWVLFKYLVYLVYFGIFGVFGVFGVLGVFGVFCLFVYLCIWCICVWYCETNPFQF